MTIRSIDCEQDAMKFSMTWVGKGRAFLVASVRSPIDAGRAAFASYVRIAKVLKEWGMEVVHERIFGCLGVEPSVRIERRRALQSRGIQAYGPVTYVEGRPPWGEGLAGVIIHAVAADDVWTLMDGGVPCGRGWRRNDSTYLMLQNIQALNKSDGRIMAKPLQARHMFERAEKILRENGASYCDVVRTWFYLSDILDWYAGFNKVRNEKYGEFGIMPGPGDRDLLLPASTGIRGDTPSGAAATMDLMAIIGERGCRPAVKQPTTFAQLDAFRYGAAFSRGALIQERDVSLIEVSGTASVDERGKSQFADDIHGQINCTFDKIEELVDKAGAGLRDIAAATVFVKSPAYASIFWEMAKDRGLEEFPAVCVVADVCREELLFEIDAEAVATGAESRVMTQRTLIDKEVKGGIRDAVSL